VSAQTQESLSASNQGRIEHAAHVGFTLLQGGLSEAQPKLSAMPTPLVDSKLESSALVSPPSPWDCPPDKFEHGGTNEPRDMQLTQDHVQIEI
jgi:hypothetical protein